VKYTQVGQPREGVSIRIETVADWYPGFDVSVFTRLLSDLLETGENTTNVLLFRKFCTFVVDKKTLLVRTPS